MEFIESKHLYLNDYGIIIPSVTQVISANIGSGYDDVPASILAAKAEYGTNIHKLIEKYHKEDIVSPRNNLEKASLMAYKRVEKKLPKVVVSEKIVMFEQRLAGTIDLVYEDGTIGDIKTYATVDEHQLLKLKWQLSLYALCLYGRDNYNSNMINHLIHLPKQMNYSSRDIEMFTLDECLEFLDRYEQSL